jgi:hypothetical protein
MSAGVQEKARNTDGKAAFDVDSPACQLSCRDQNLILGKA